MTNTFVRMTTTLTATNFKKGERMDTRDGRIRWVRDLMEIEEEDRPYMQPMDVPPTPEQRIKMKVGRNHNCPCGSGVKFKKCCMFRLNRGEGYKVNNHGL